MNYKRISFIFLMFIAVLSSTTETAYAESFALTSISPNPVTLGSNIIITGTITPSPQSGVTTYVHYTRQDGSAVTTTPVHNQQDFSSGFTVDYYKPDQPGTWHVYAEAYVGGQLIGTSNSMTFTVQGTGFSVSTPIQTGIYQGSSGTVTVSVSSSSQQSYAASLSLSGLPSGVSYSFSPQTGSPSFTSTLTLTVGSNVPKGDYTVTIMGTGGGYSASNSFTLSVYQTSTPPPTTVPPTTAPPTTVPPTTIPPTTVPPTTVPPTTIPPTTVPPTTVPPTTIPPTTAPPTTVPPTIPPTITPTITTPTPTIAPFSNQVRISSIILNRNPAKTTKTAFFLSVPPSVSPGVAWIRNWGIFAAITIENFGSTDFEGAIRTFRTDPSGSQDDPESGRGYVSVTAGHKETFYIPLHGYKPLPFYQAQFGTWKFRIELGQGSLVAWKPIDSKTFEISLTDLMDGPKIFGREVPIKEFLQGQEPSISEDTITILDFVIPLIEAKFSCILCDDAGVISLSDLLPKPSSITDIQKISSLFYTSTSTNLDVSKLNGNKFRLRPRYVVIGDTLDVGAEKYNFAPTFDRVITIVKIPSSISISDKGDADIVRKSDDGQTSVVWFDNYYDKKLVCCNSVEHHVDILLRNGGSSIAAYTYFEVGPLSEKPSEGKIAIFDYNKWVNDPENVVWIIVATKQNEQTVQPTEESAQSIVDIISNFFKNIFGW